MLVALGIKILTGFGIGSESAKRLWWLPLLTIAAFAALLFYVTVTSIWDGSIDRAEDAGAAGAIIRGQEQTLDQLGDANDAEQDLRAGGERNARRYADCLRDAIEPAGCERHNPDAGAK